MEEKNWKDFIPIYLKDFYSQFTSYGNEAIHALIVEGSTDEEFYWALFDKSYFILDNKKIVLNTPKKKILSNFSDNFKNLLSKSEPYKLKQHQKEFQKADKSDYKSYQFVTECIEYFEKNKIGFKNLDCYGLIDNDFGHNELIRNLVNIAVTKYHDRETCIMRCYLPEYFDLLTNKNVAVEHLAKIIDVCFKQGVLEKESFKYVENNPEKLNKTIVSFTHGFFKYNDGSLIGFDFDKYFDNYYVFYSDLIENYKKRLKLEYTFEDELINILSRWLIDKNTTKIDDDRLDRIFKYCNGHILLNQMILCGKDIYLFNTEKEFTDSVISKIAFEKQKYYKLFETLPLQPYKEYRIQKGLYTKV